MDQGKTKALDVVVDNYDSLVQLHKTACDMSRELLIRKNNDYAGKDDPFYNLHDGGAYGILIRLGDKHKRLLNFERRALSDPEYRFQVSDEMTEDTVLDIINYANLYLAYKHRRKLK